MRTARTLPAVALLTALVASPAGAQIGETEFVDGNTTIPTDVMDTVGQLLPERSNSGAAYISQVYTPNLLVTETCTVSVHFVWEGAGYKNSIGYFTYTQDPFAIVDRQLVFPNLSMSGSGGFLQVGDNSVLRDAGGTPRVFTAGERIGFFLVANGFSDEPQVVNWDALTASLPSTDPAVNGASSATRGTFTTIDAFNPENAVGQPEIARHVAMIRQDPVPGFLGGDPFVLVGLEDLDRQRADDDFNDAVFIVNATPADALDTGDLPNVDPGDPDGDGVSGVEDHYPTDAERAIVNTYPAYGWNALGLEDLYPNLGDGDYNDTVLAYRFTTVSDSAGNVKDVRGTFHLLARGASLDHRLGIHFPGIPGDATGTIEVERWLSDDGDSHIVEAMTSVEDLVAAEGRRLESILPHSSLAMPNVPGKFVVNTQDGTVIDRLGASSRFVMTFDTAVDPAVLGAPPYDIYWLVNDGSNWVDIHMAGFDSFPDHPPGYPVEQGETAYIDEAGYPWLIDVPFGWRFPLESTSIAEAFPGFLDWAASPGTTDGDWYDTPTEVKTGRPASDYFNGRDWTVDLPDP